jgi:hypothetical protein
VIELGIKVFVPAIITRNRTPDAQQPLRIRRARRCGAFCGPVTGLNWVPGGPAVHCRHGRGISVTTVEAN